MDLTAHPRALLSTTPPADLILYPRRELAITRGHTLTMSYRNQLPTEMWCSDRSNTAGYGVKMPASLQQRRHQFG